MFVAIKIFVLGCLAIFLVVLIGSFIDGEKIHFPDFINSKGTIQADANGRIDSIAIDLDYIYMAGGSIFADKKEGSIFGKSVNAQGLVPVDIQWRIEKRKINTGSLVSEFGKDGIIEENLSSGIDEVKSIAIDSNYIYAAGCNGSKWHVEKRDINTGDLVSEFGKDGVVEQELGDELSITIDSRYIYMAGHRLLALGNSKWRYQWRIEKRDINTGKLVPVFGKDGVIENNAKNLGLLRSIIIDSKYIYVSGSGRWRIEKRDINTGALVPAFGGDGAVESNRGKRSEPLSIAIDSNYIYAAGFEEVSPNNYQWRIEKRKINTGSLVSEFGKSGVVELKMINGLNQAKSIAIDLEYVYIAGYKGSPDIAGSNAQWHIEKRNINTGFSVSEFGGDGAVESNHSNGWDEAASIVVDSSYIYVGGGANLFEPNSFKWCIEKRDINTGALK